MLNSSEAVSWINEKKPLERRSIQDVARSDALIHSQCTKMQRVMRQMGNVLFCSDVGVIEERLLKLNASEDTHKDIVRFEGVIKHLPKEIQERLRKSTMKSL